MCMNVRRRVGCVGVRKSIFPLESSAAGPSAVGADIDQLDENREEFVEDRVMELAVGSHGPVV